MMSFIRAAEAVGLGACPISTCATIRRKSAACSACPTQVFPVAGLCVGYPAEAGRITPRLPLEVTVHVDRYDEVRRQGKNRRLRPPARTRCCRTASSATPNVTAKADFYGWSEDKARQYAVPERADFGAFIRKKGFSLK